MPDLFAISDPWGDVVRLSDRVWQRLIAKHAEIAPYLETVRETIEHPSRVYEGLSFENSKVFYSKRGVVRERPFRGCHVAVVVRYTYRPAWIPTAYLTSGLGANRGKLLYEE